MECTGLLCSYRYKQSIAATKHSTFRGAAASKQILIGHSVAGFFYTAIVAVGTMNTHANAKQVQASRCDQCAEAFHGTQKIPRKESLPFFIRGQCRKNVGNGNAQQYVVATCLFATVRWRCAAATICLAEWISSTGEKGIATSRPEQAHHQHGVSLVWSKCYKYVKSVHIPHTGEIESHCTSCLLCSWHLSCHMLNLIQQFLCCLAKVRDELFTLVMSPRTSFILPFPSGHSPRKAWQTLIVPCSMSAAVIGSPASLTMPSYV